MRDVGKNLFWFVIFKYINVLLYSFRVIDTKNNFSPKTALIPEFKCTTTCFDNYFYPTSETFNT